ncbi:MAG: hypothetical protein CVU11_05985 [Bacteroidetes bacterium HGW-Bacteroidetes-6]|jgi:hypothetical protein|nr:MAG: hypothetical protein CVU11_05985 [Bacteroidetes bacterium HGW-Bacteroidetes-6]
MKKLIIPFIALLVFCTQLEAQESSAPKTKEYCFTLPVPTDLSNIQLGFDYKVQLKNQTFLKLSAFSLSFTDQVNDPGSSTGFRSEYLSYSGGIGCGLEFRKNITDKFTFFHGPNIGFSYDYTAYTNDDPSVVLNLRKNSLQSIHYSVSYTLGFMYSISSHILVLAQMNPGIFLATTENKFDLIPVQNYNSIIAGLNISDNIGGISLVYRR